MARSVDARASDAAAADLACACATAQRLSRLLTRLYDEHLRPHGLESTQFAVLSMLEASGPATQASIGARFGLDKTTVSRNLKWLRDRGWIADASARDARERPCELTAEGRRRLAKAAPAWRNAQRALRDSMSAAEWRAMWTTFGAVTHGSRRAHAT